MGALENVIRINTSEVYDQIELFLDKKQMKSGSMKTREAYEKDIKDFFEYLTKGKKEVVHLQIEDIKLNQDDIINFQLYLAKNGLGNKSINRKVSTVTQLYGRFHRRGYIKDILPFDEADRLKEGKNYHGVFSVEEVFRMADYIMIKPRVKKRLTKYNLILFAMDTCLRKSAILNLKWSDFIVHEDRNEVEIKAIDKGNEERNLIISKEFYDELLQIKNEKVSPSEKFDQDAVFKISETGIQDMMNMFKLHFKFNDKRNLVFHSYRKCGVTYQYRISNDVFQAKKASGHKNLENLLIYIGERDYGVLGAVSSAGKLDSELYLKVTHEQLIKGIEKLNSGERLLLNIKLNEIINKKTE